MNNHRAFWLLLLLASIAIAAPNRAASQPSPNSADPVQRERYAEGKKQYELVHSARSDGIATWEWMAYAESLSKKGAYPAFVPDPHAGGRWLAKRLATYNGPDRATLEGAVRRLNEFAAEYDREVAAANAGDPQALYNLGLRFRFEDNGVPQDKARGLEYIRMAAQKGHARANYHMAHAMEDQPGGRPQAIAYMQEAYRLGLKDAAPFLRDWNAPLSPQHAAAAAAAMRQSGTAASTLTAGAFAPLFWGSAPVADVQKVAYSIDQLRPDLEMVKARKVTMPAGSGYKAWGLPLGSSPTRAQFLASANRFHPCIERPVTPNNVMGMELSAVNGVTYEEWSYGNRKAIYIQCYIGNGFFRGPSDYWMVFYLVDQKLVAVRAEMPIYAPATEGMGDRILCSAEISAPSQLLAGVQKSEAGWKVIRAHSLSQTPLDGQRLGHWYTLSRPGAVMHIYTANWQNTTIEGTSSVAKCGLGWSDYLIATPEMNAALRFDATRLPFLRIGRN